MRKIVRLISMAVVLLMLVSFSVASSAASTEILKGTPVIDGIIDEIYTQSLAIPVGEGTDGIGFYSTAADSAAQTDLGGTIYLLWDDKFLYICSDVKDGDVLSAADDYVTTDPNPWMNDATEHWVDLLTGAAVKCSVDAFAKRVFGNNETDFDFASIVKAATQGNGGYITEIAIPLPAVKEGDEIGYKNQTNDYNAEGTVVAVAANYDGEGTQAPIYYKLGKAVVMPEPEPEVVEVAEVETNPETTDVNVMFYIFGAISFLGMVVIKTSKKESSLD